MIKDVVIHNRLLRIATGTFVCMVGYSSRAAMRAVRERLWKSCASPNLGALALPL
jgi:hypothetical protein